MKVSQKIQILLPFWLFCGLLTWGVSDHIFFWDTVQLASKHAHWYYEQQFQYFFLPDNINSGHPPLFGIYLAFCWTVFGKTLMVSHFSVFPFLLGIVLLLFKIGVHFGNIKNAKYLMLLVLIDPFFAGQSILVSPDIVLIFAFLWCIYGILKTQFYTILLSTILLGLISMRGMMVVFSLYLWWCFTAFFLHKEAQISTKRVLEILIKKIIPFIPAGLIASIFLLAHFLNFGWIGYHADSPWAGSFESVNFMGFLKNVGVLGWRFLDFGRLFLLGVLAWLLWKSYLLASASSPTSVAIWTSSGNSEFPAKNKVSFQLISLIIILSFILTPSLVLHKGLLSHRYLLPITLAITLLFYHLCFQILNKPNLQKLVFNIAFVGLFTGNLWIYPKHIAQGWDATLAHVPYYRLRQKMIDYIEVEQIPYEQIGSVFPNIGVFEIYDLNEKQVGFVKKDFVANEYFFYSTVFNDISDEELTELTNHWLVVKQFKSLGIEVILYKKR